MMVAETYDRLGSWNSGGFSTVRGLDPARRPYLGDGRPFGRSGGAEVLFADGSVRWVTDSVDARLFEAMATIHGGEPIPLGRDEWISTIYPPPDPP